VKFTLDDGTPIKVLENAGRIDADAGDHAGHQIFEAKYDAPGGLTLIACECAIIVKPGPTREERLFRTMMGAAVVAGIIVAILLKNFDWYSTF